MVWEDTDERPAGRRGGWSRLGRVLLVVAVAVIALDVPFDIIKTSAGSVRLLATADHGRLFEAPPGDLPEGRAALEAEILSLLNDPAIVRGIDGVPVEGGYSFDGCNLTLELRMPGAVCRGETDAGTVERKIVRTELTRFVTAPAFVDADGPPRQSPLNGVLLDPVVLPMVPSSARAAETAHEMYEVMRAIPRAPGASAARPYDRERAVAADIDTGLLHPIVSDSGAELLFCDGSRAAFAPDRGTRTLEVALGNRARLVGLLHAHAAAHCPTRWWLVGR